MSSTLSQLAIRIIQAQELIIGPLAWKEAKKVDGLIIDIVSKRVSFSNSDEKVVIDLLVKQYMFLFGDASKIVCQSAVQDIIKILPEEDIPKIFK